MKNPMNDPDAKLDRVLDSIRTGVPDDDTVEQAGRRVWARLSEATTVHRVDPASIDTIRGCKDIQALIPSLVDGTLPPARAILIEDHSRECVPCRRALRDARSGIKRQPTLETAPEFESRSTSRGFRWAVAAALLLTALLGGYGAYRYLPGDPARAAVRVASIEGSLYRVAGNWSSSAAVGEEIPGGQVFRTAKGSRAVVQLADGSRVEMNERSELSVSARRFGTTLHLDRGSIIVEAAKQGARRLYVDSGDCRVAVTGTIFSVNHGTKGSRVSVIEGEVRVRQSGDERILHPGDQVSTNPNLTTIPVASEISWSRNLDQHLAVLAELTRLRRDIAQLPHPAPLRDTRLLDLVPPRTAMFAAVPNVSGTLAEAHRMLRERLETSPALRAWWEETMGGSGGDEELASTMERVRAFGSQFRDEMVISVQTKADGGFEGITVLAELARPQEFRAFLETQLREMPVQGGAPDVRIVDDPAQVVAGGRDELLLYIHGDLFAASNSVARLREVQAAADGTAPNPFVASTFHAKLADAYAAETSWLVGVDLESILQTAASHGNPDESSMLRESGLLDARHLIIEGDEQEGTSRYRAVLSFEGPRSGIAAWLAEPAPMGALDFVSPDATLAAAFVAKNPQALTDDLFRMLERGAPELRSRLAAFEQEHGVDFTRDFAAPLGGEFAVALDGPVLPSPAWKFMVEVYDPPRLQQTLAWLVNEINRTHGDDGPDVHLEEEQAGGRTWYTLRSGRLPVEVHYTFVDGYLVAAPSRTLVEDAIARRANGTGLPSSPQFARLLPQGSQANFSALAYQNFGSVLNPLAKATGATRSPEGSPESRLMAALGGGLEPTLVYAYGEPDRIVAASTRPGGLFGSDLEMLLGLQSIFASHARVENAIEQRSQDAAEGTEAQ